MDITNLYAYRIDELAVGMLLRKVLNGFGIKVCSVKGFLICLVAAIIYVGIINLIFK